jgi:Transposase DDE domain
MHQRNAIEGTISELTRAHGMRRHRYRGLAKARFQNLFIATACNIKRWLKLEGANRDQSASYFPAEALQKAFERTFSALRGSISSLEGLANSKHIIYVSYVNRLVIC